MEEARRSLWRTSCDGTETDRRNRLRFKAWMLAWMGSWLAITAGVTFEWLPKGAVSTTATLLSALLGLVALGAYRRYLREADELRRKIELEALAAAVGVGVLWGLTAWLLVVTGAIPAVDVLWLVLAMILTHGLGVFIGQRRYS